MAFDPDAYLAESSGGFDPDAYLAERGPDAMESERQDFTLDLGKQAPEQDPIKSGDIVKIMKWARANPNNPRAQAVLPKLEAMESSSKGRMADKIQRGMQVTGTDAASLGWADEALEKIRGPEKASQFKQEVQDFRQEHPVMSFMSSLGGSLPAGIATGAGGITAQLATSGAMGAIGGLGNAEDKDVTDAALGALVGMGAYGVGKGLGAGLQYGGGKLMQALGKGGQVPQQAYEKVAELVGRNADDIAASAKPTSGSKLQRGLAEAVEAGKTARLGPEVGGGAKAAETSLRSSLGEATEKVLQRPISQLDDVSRSALMDAMVAGMKKRGLSVSTEAMAETFNETVEMAGRDPAEITAREALRLVNQRDPAFAMKLYQNTIKRFGPMRAGLDVDPREAAASRSIGGMLDDIGAGKQNRFNVVGQEHGADARAQLPVAELQSMADEAVPPTEQAAAVARATARDAARAQNKPPIEDMVKTNAGARGMAMLNEPRDTQVLGNDSRNALRQSMRGDFQQSPEFAQQAGEMMAEVNDDVLARGVNPAKAGKGFDQLLAEMNPKEARLQQATKPWTLGDDSEAQGLVRQGAEAAEKLRSINAGKKKLDQYGTAATIGGAFIPGVNKFAALGATGRMLASDKVAGAARSVESLGAKVSSPDALTRSWLANPSLLWKVSQRNDQLGRGARFVLEGLQEGGGDALKARMFVLSLQPWFREEVSVGQQQGEQ